MAASDVAFHVRFGPASPPCELVAEDREARARWLRTLGKLVSSQITTELTEMMLIRKGSGGASATVVERQPYGSPDTAPKRKGGGGPSRGPSASSTIECCGVLPVGRAATMATIKEGKLLKRSPQSTLFGGKKMQERVFILRADALFYYLPSDAEGIAAGRSGEASSRCKGMIPIEDVIGVYRAAELPTDSKGIQKMARSLMPSEAPATIFIPVAQRDSAERMKGDVRIYELRDSGAAGAASWVEALRAAVDLPHRAAASAQESASAAKSAVTKARKAQVALEAAQAAEEAKDAIAAADAANVEAIGAESAAVKAAAALQRIPTTMQDLHTAAAASANDAREGAAVAARAADAAADVAAKKEAREARRQQSGARTDPEATEAATPTAAAAAEAAVEAAAFETAAAAVADAVASAAIPQTPPPHPAGRVSWYADATCPAATSMHMLTTAPPTSQVRGCHVSRCERCPPTRHTQRCPPTRHTECAPQSYSCDQPREWARSLLGGFVTREWARSLLGGFVTRDWASRCEAELTSKLTDRLSSQLRAGWRRSSRSAPGTSHQTRILASRHADTPV